MQEIKCPKCGTVFTVDESGYSAIVAQVRDEQFHKDLHERLAQFEKEKQTEIKLAESKAEQEKEKTVAQLNQEIAELKSKIDAANKTNAKPDNTSSNIYLGLIFSLQYLHFPPKHA